MSDTSQRTVVLTLAGCLALAACTSACSDDSQGTTVATSSPGCEAEQVATPGTTVRTMTSGGEERRFQLVVPDGYDGRTPLPVLFGLHPDVIDFRLATSFTGIDEVAATRNVILVRPSGLVDGTVPYWLAAKTDPPGHDVVFISDLLDLLEAELCVDPSRVYSTGIANGGQMSSLLACELGDRIAAVAPVAGPEWPTECGGRPVPVMAFHGDQDPFVSYQDDRGDAREIAERHFWKGNVPDQIPEHEGAEQAMANWAAHNGCDPEPLVETISDEVIRRTWQNCDADTVFFYMPGGGHTWPGHPVPAFEPVFGHTTLDIDATELMVEFFLQHQR
jgi:polyhydroxybutyrate depolymerase